MMRIWLVLLAQLALSGCDGFREVRDGGGDAPVIDGKAMETGAHDRGTGTDGAGGQLGSCCAKAKDCSSAICINFESGPYFCTRKCLPTSDDCPVGLFCSLSGYCVPPNVNYTCGPEVAAARHPQPYGGCCAKKSDCESKHCMSRGDEGQYFCSQKCTRRPDDCPAGYSCSLSLYCLPPGDSTCTFYP